MKSADCLNCSCSPTQFLYAKTYKNKALRNIFQRDQKKQVNFSGPWGREVNIVVEIDHNETGGSPSSPGKCPSNGAAARTQANDTVYAGEKT